MRKRARSQRPSKAEQRRRDKATQRRREHRRDKMGLRALIRQYNAGYPA